MAKFLANENVPGAAVRATQQAGVDLTWVSDLSPGADDESVLAMARTGERVADLHRNVNTGRDRGRFGVSAESDLGCRSSLSYIMSGLVDFSRRFVTQCVPPSVNRS